MLEISVDVMVEWFHINARNDLINEGFFGDIPIGGVMRDEDIEQKMKIKTRTL